MSGPAEVAAQRAWDAQNISGMKKCTTEPAGHDTHVAELIAAQHRQQQRDTTLETIRQIASPADFLGDRRLVTAREVIAQVLRSAGILLPNDYTPAWSYDRKLNELAAEIDTALGGLTQEWGVVIDYPPRPEDDYPGAVVILDTYKLREAAEIVKRTKYPEDCYEVRPRWVSGWNQASE